MFFCKYWEISKKAIFKNICVRLLLKRFQEVIDQDFLSGESLSKTSRLSNITKIPFAFKPEPSLNLTPTIYFELRFPIFIITIMTKKQTIVVPGLLVIGYFALASVESLSALAILTNIFCNLPMLIKVVRSTF